MNTQLINELKNRANGKTKKGLPKKNKSKEKSMKVQRETILELIKEYERLSRMNVRVDSLKDEIKRLTVQNMILTKK